MTSYAAKAAKGPKQTPQQATAPPVQEINASTDTTSVGSADAGNVHSVPPQFKEVFERGDGSATVDETLEIIANENDEEEEEEEDDEGEEVKDKKQRIKKAISRKVPSKKEAARSVEAALTTPPTVAIVNGLLCAGLFTYLYQRYDGGFGWSAGKTVGIGLGALVALVAVEGAAGVYAKRHSK